MPTEVRDEELFSREATISSGINFSKYANIPVNVDGENAPKGINTFAESGLRQLCKDNVAKSGYEVKLIVYKKNFKQSSVTIRNRLFHLFQ